MPLCCRTSAYSAAQKRAAELTAASPLYGTCMQMLEEHGCHCQDCDCGEHFGGSQFAGCSFGVGDGVGGHEKYLELTPTSEECETLVKSREPTANGATWGPTTKKCYAEFGMTSTNNNEIWRTCKFDGCSFGVGDGVGGHEKFLEVTPSATACEALVRRNEPTANGATWGPTNKKCYAEFGMTSTNTNETWVTCKFKGTSAPASSEPVDTGAPEYRMKACHTDVCGTLKNLSTTLDADTKLHTADKNTAADSLASANVVKANEENAKKLADALQADHQKKAAEYAKARDDAKAKAAAAKVAYDATFARYQEAKGRLANMKCPSV